MIGHRLMGNSPYCSLEIFQQHKPTTIKGFLFMTLKKKKKKKKIFFFFFFFRNTVRSLHALELDISVAILGFRSLTLWLLGRPEQAVTDASRALKNVYEIGQAATSMFAMNYTAWTHTLCGDCSKALSILAGTSRADSARFQA